MTNSQQSSRTKEVELPSGKYLLCEMKSSAITEVVNFDEKTSWIRWYLEDFSDNGNINLPSGQWQIIGKANELSEQQWKAVVDYQLHPFSTKVYGYTYKNQESYSPFKKAKLAGHSLIKSHSMNPDTTLILKLQQ